MLDNAVEIELGGETLVLLPQRAVYRPAKRQLLLSDVHLGKATHFRRNGIPLPAQAHLKDLDQLQYLLRRLAPESVLILGDLFHSDYNREWLWLKALLMEYPATTFVLVEGNHDLLQQDTYHLPNLRKLQVLEEEHFIFTHAPLEAPHKINICGHLHPGYLLQGPAREALRLPCFYLQGRTFLLPAFGQLTGLHLLDKAPGACLYLVTGTRVLPC